MRVYFITVRSVTFGQRAERELRKGGLACTLQRTPRWMEEQGCGYALRIWTDNIRPAVNLLRQERILMKRLYIQGNNGQLEELNL